MRPRPQVQLVRGPAPQQLAIGIVKRDPVNTILNWLTELERKPYGDGARDPQRVWRAIFRVNDLPACEVSPGMVTPSRTRRHPAVIAHRSFVSVDNSVRRSLLAN